MPSGFRRWLSNLISIGDPALAAYFRVGNPNYSGVPVGEDTALGISAFWRAVNLISGSVAQLPMQTFREADAGQERTGSVFDDPGKVIGLTPFEWKQLVILYQLLHGAAPLAHVRNNGGGLIGLVPLHPLTVQMLPPTKSDDVTEAFRRKFRVTLQGGESVEFTDGEDITYCPALTLDGRSGISLISAARNSLGTAIAGDRAAAKLFSEGALVSGMVTPEDGEVVDEDDAKAIKQDLDQRVAGWENAAQIAVINRRLKFSPWTLSAKDAQYIESRAFQVQEIARWTGVPANLLMDPGAVSTWGTGVEIQNRGLAKFNLSHWTTRLEQQLSRLLPTPRFVKFDYTEWTKPTPEQEIELLLKQTGRPVLTVNEARKRLGLDPVDGGDTLAGPDAVLPPEETSV